MLFSFLSVNNYIIYIQYQMVFSYLWHVEVF